MQNRSLFLPRALRRKCSPPRGGASGGHDSGKGTGSDWPVTVHSPYFCDARPNVYRDAPFSPCKAASMTFLFPLPTLHIAKREEG